MNIAQRLKRARAYAELTQNELAKRAGVAQPVISRLEKGIAQGSTSLTEIAFACGVDPMWLASGTGEMLSFSRTSDLIPAPADTMSGKWPMLTWKSVGGIMDTSELKHLSKTEWVPGPPCPEDGFCLVVQTDSMTAPNASERSYPIGSRIYVDPNKVPKHGSRVVVSILGADEADFKIYVISGGRRYLKAADPQIPTIEFDQGMYIVGVVVGTYIPESE